MKKLTAILLCAALCLSGCGMDDATEYEVSSETSSVISSEEESLPVAETPEPAETENIFIYICGAVNMPGVYELPAGSRVYEAIDAAGGLTADADMRTLNQAELLNDGQQVTVYTEDEVADSGNGSAAVQSADDGLININTADLSALMTLPGIGAARAEAVIAYREEFGAFETPRDICNVTGIKEKLFARIESLIKV